jgi:hypothetical protein
MRIIKTIKEFINSPVNENVALVNSILDKINKSGKSSLSHDELTYLDQFSTGKINRELEKWLMSKDDETYDYYGKKLLFDEFEEGEDLLYNTDKLIRIINRHLGKKPFSNNADWGGAKVWNLEGDSNYHGLFLVLGDDELVIIKRDLIGDEYSDDLVSTIETHMDLYKTIGKYSRNQPRH